MRVCPAESQTSVVESLETVYGDKRLFDLLQDEQKITTSAEYAKKMEKDLFATWVVNRKPLNDVFKLLGLNRVGYKLLEDPLIEKFIKFATEVRLSKNLYTRTAKEAFVENEILNGVKLASNAGKLRSTVLEKALFRLWFTHEKSIQKEVFEMLFREDDLVKILNNGGNLFEIPLFVTFLKYAEAYSGTKRLATKSELEKVVSSRENRVWKTDPTTEVGYVDRKTDVGSIMNSKFHREIDTLYDMILSARKSSKKSTLFAGQRVEDELFRFWTKQIIEGRLTPDKMFVEYFKLNAEMTPKQLFKNRMFHWWIDYMEYFRKQPEGKIQMRSSVLEVFDSSADSFERLEIMYNAPKTKEFAEKVLTELLNERIIHNETPTTIENKHHGIWTKERLLYGTIMPWLDKQNTPKLKRRKRKI
ncbi:unnamed protein product [Peronospora destructor]|uniref:RxLR effector protein n=1 Tax=Peronospora destructor TaxID=86335 RepID=A0AAV0VA69_9STRA|nr:unnamed protein product [Peronospora destructor]